MKPFITNFAARSLVKDIGVFGEIITDAAALQSYQEALDGRSTTFKKSLKGAVKFGASQAHNEFSENVRLAQHELTRIRKHTS